MEALVSTCRGFFLAGASVGDLAVIAAHPKLKLRQEG
jgi:hypothetical protein